MCVCVSHVAIYLVYNTYECVYACYIHISYLAWTVDLGIPEMQRTAQAIQVYDRICEFEGVKGSSEIQQKMTLGTMSGQKLWQNPRALVLFVRRQK